MRLCIREKRPLLIEKIFLSAPTSFGKTSLLLEFIIQHHKSLANVLIIVPTNSLLEELYGSVYDDYSKLIDYGVSNDLVMKLHDGHITIAELQEERYDKSIFDEYEQLMLSDFLSIL